MQRSKLLPATLKRTTSYFVEYTDAIDEVFKSIDAKIDLLNDVRNPHMVDAHCEEKIERHEMLDLSDWPIHPDIEKQLSFLDLSKVPSSAQLIVLSNISRYWRQKGRKAEDFADFCLSKEWLTLLT